VFDRLHNLLRHGMGLSSATILCPYLFTERPFYG
jgi:hypothetical protein